MAVIFETLNFRPAVWVHQFFPSAGATRGPRVPTINCIAGPPALPPAWPRSLEARWAVDSDGRLACAWVRTSPAWLAPFPQPAPARPGSPSPR